MSNIRFELNSAGVQELLKGGAMQSILSGHAADTANRAGVGFNYSVKVGAKRAYANIYADSFRAYFSNLKHNTLLKALK